MLQLSVSPRRNHGADSTLVEFDIREVGGEDRRWNLTRDVLDDFLERQPARRQGRQAGRVVLPRRPQGRRCCPRRCATSPASRACTPGATARRRPSSSTRATQPITVWTKLAARSVFVHPAQRRGRRRRLAQPHRRQGPRHGPARRRPPRRPRRRRLAARTQEGRPRGRASPRGASGRSRSPRRPRERAALAARLPAPAVAYAVTEGDADDARLHLRGDPEKLGKVVPRRWLSLFGGERVTGSRAAAGSSSPTG